MTANIVRDKRRRFHPDPEHSDTLPRTYYWDPDIFAREKEEIFFKTWQFVGYVSELRSPGDFVTATIIDQPVFVIRAKEGALRAYYNVCMHRGHILLEGKGNVRMITCPFHAWTYDLEGNLKAAGNSENVTGFDHGDFCLPEIQVEEFGNMAYVNLDASASSLKSQAGGLEQEFRTFVPHFDDLVFARRDTFDIKCNWKFVFDQMECYHCPVIHPQIMGKEDSYLQHSFEITAHEYWSQHLIRANTDVVATMQENLPYRFGADDELKDAYIWWLWPNDLWVAHHGPSNWKMMHLLPTGIETCIQHVDYFFLNDPPQAGEVEMMDYFSGVLQRQDIDTMEKQQLGVHARGYTQGRLMVDRERSWRSEHGTHHFDKLLWETLNGPNY